MSKAYKLFFLLLGALIFAAPALAQVAGDERDVVWTPGENDHLERASKAAKLRVSGANDPDTVWIGHIADPGWIPKDKNGTDLPGVPAGGYGPYKVGRGPHLPGIGPGTSYNATWDFDHLQPGENDSLQGWWPIAGAYTAGGFFDTEDKNRSFYGLDWGNQGNYVINQGSPKRTFGVTGYWHRDNGSASAPLADPTPGTIPGPNPEWAALGGTHSAWCGLRVDGDNSFIDPVTGNGYNSGVQALNAPNSYVVLQNTAGGTDQNYPGVGSQWDQILYRDVSLAAGASLTISFKYVHGLSRTVGGNVTQRTGYFWKDPLKITKGFPNDGNFISRTEADPAQGGPADSFTVYVGTPVERVGGYTPLTPDDFVASDGATYEIYDLQRRWYSEILKTNGAMVRVLSASGFSDDGVPGPLPPGVPPEVITFGPVVIPGGAGTSLEAARAASPNSTVRIAFRVKTNRGADDEDFFVTGFTSFTRGGAIIDDVVANGTTIGDFELPGSIDNSTGVSALTAWKSTGKPPGIFSHVHGTGPGTPGGPVSWQDPCSPPNFTDPTSPNRACNMVGNVLTAGDHDGQEKPGGLFGSPFQDRGNIVVSPTINFKSNGPGDYNAMGIDSDVANATFDYNVFFDLHTPGFRGSLNGGYWQYGAQVYPGTQPNGGKVWAQPRFPGFIVSSGAATCGISASSAFDPGLRALGLFRTSNANGIPDSVRVMLNNLRRCFTLVGLNSVTCSPASGIHSGAHFDNMAFQIVDGAPPAGLAVSPWFFYMDAFPATNVASFTASVFDTAAARVKGSLNRSIQTGLVRPNIPADSAWVVAVGNNMRIDLIFRILPGVGNYVSLGNRASGLRRVPTATTVATANASSGNFWENYMGDVGAFGTTGGVAVHAASPSGWSPNVWMSARMDTVETNFFPANAMGAPFTTGGLANGSWHTMYHESDPRYAELGIAKNRCFSPDPSSNRTGSCSSKNPTTYAQCNVICGTVPSAGGFNGTYPPLVYSSDPNSGLSLSEGAGLTQGRTYEYTKIIPDGQLTPGAHVQYFYRRTPGSAGGTTVDILPDTNTVSFGNAMTDWGRWYRFGVLPDRWKDPAYGGTGMACMIVDDHFSRNQDEGLWVSAADSIGLTEPAKRGAHNGWTAAGGENGANLAQFTFRRDHGGQAGSRYDLWNGNAGESGFDGNAHFGGRTAVVPAATELLGGKENRQGPTADMLRNFYRQVVMLMAGNQAVFWGPLPNLTHDDIGLMTDFANVPAGTGQPRSVYLIGSGFAEALTLNWNPVNGAQSFLASYFGVNFDPTSAQGSPNYRVFSANPKQVAYVDPVVGSAFYNQAVLYNNPASGHWFGVSDGCGIENDVLAVNTAVPSAAAQTMWENVGPFGPYVHSIYAPDHAPSGRKHITYYDGSRITRLGSPNTILPTGRAGFRLDLWTAMKLAGGSFCGPQGIPVGVGDSPNGDGTAFVNYLNLRSSNPMKSGKSVIAFGLKNTERVEVRMYDVTGRLVKMVANRVFVGGQEHNITWDGTDEAGNRVKSGVYFYQLRTPTWTSQKKLAVLAN